MMRQWFKVRPILQVGHQVGNLREIYIKCKGISEANKILQGTLRGVGFPKSIVDGPFKTLREASTGFRQSCQQYSRAATYALQIPTTPLLIWRSQTLCYIPKISRPPKAVKRERLVQQNDAALTYCICGDSAYKHIKRPHTSFPEWGACSKFGCDCSNFVEKPLTPPKPPDNMPVTTEALKKLQEAASKVVQGGGRLDKPPAEPTGPPCTNRNCRHHKGRHSKIGFCTVATCACMRFQNA